MRRIGWNFFWGFLKDFLSVLGAFGVVVTITSYFDQLKAPNNSLKSSPVLIGMLFLALVWGIWNNRPRNSFEYKLNNKDIRMRLVVGDIFKQEGAVIVPINSEFDAYLGGSVLKSNSIKAQVIRDYFDGDCSKLGDKLKKPLKSEIYKTSKNGTAYKMGTTVAVEQNGRKFYFSVNSEKINQGRVETKREDLLPTLSGIWAYLANYGAKGNIAVPILGTGNGRLSMPREEVIKEIVRSFIASCSEKSYCDKLTIVIHPKDVAEYEIDIDALDEFLCLHCKHATFATDRNSAPIGRPVSAGND